MKDIIANRQRISFRKKIRLGWLVLKENGVFWTVYLGIYYLCSGLADAAFRHLHALAQRKGLPGINSRSLNSEIWDNWDWQKGGDEWTHSAEWKESLLRNVLHKYLPAQKNLLEIGPGAGRWTEHLQRLASFLIGVDISQKCVDICRLKFGHYGNTKFFVTPGNNLTGVEDQSIDAIWSFDVFVHINADDVAGYVREFRRVLRPGGVGVVHHAKRQIQGGWRSNLTAERFRELLQQHGFTVVEQFDNWADQGKTVPVGLYEDVITVFRIG